ncbi:hypothetical protein AVL62_08675 [Serinicoccus chungangensis]|uniref:Uncharacterized protein n=1 Tax=Serinicoccus chungangensis TaxID=767452 RepID=A0A0W8I2P1_9MICO|nr:hypothetical protein [Serinicoccus chungangensis]KUG51992.1 hypothetical protein AVL62_08675 [Serinicoccus chungangensis]
MRRALTMATVMSLAVLTGACSAEDEDAGTTPESSSQEESAENGDDAMQSGEEGMAVSDDPACQGFFAGQGTPLAERAATQRDVVGSGDDLDPVAFSEVTLLSGRLMTLAEEADEDHAALLERINAPFEEVNDAVVEEGTRTEDVIAIPDVDVSDSEAAQTELEEACAA